MNTADRTLNPVLYTALVQTFGPVRVSHPGEPLTFRTAGLFDEGGPPRVERWGETYKVTCPQCRSEFALSVSHAFGTTTDSGRPLDFLVACHQRGCFKDPARREDLLGRIDPCGLLPDTFLRYDRAREPVARYRRLPEPSTRVDRLPESHRVSRLIARLGLDRQALGREYGLALCPDSDDKLVAGRVVVPYQNGGRLEGWQVMAPGGPHEPDGSLRPRFLSAPGMPASTLVYNLDRAREYTACVVVPTPAEVWAFGPMAVCPAAGRLNDNTARALMLPFAERPVVVLFPPEDLDGEEVCRFVRQMRPATLGQVVKAALPFWCRRLPDRHSLHGVAAEAAGAVGVRLSFARRTAPEPRTKPGPRRRGLVPRAD